MDAFWDDEWNGYILVGVVIVEGEGAVLGLNLGRPIVTNGDFATRLFLNYFGQYLLGHTACRTSWRSAIFVSVCFCVSHRWAKTAKPTEMPFRGGRFAWDQWDHLMGFKFSTGRGIFEGHMPTHGKV